MPTFRLNQLLSGDVGAINPSITATAENAQTFTIVLPANAENVEINVAFAYARLKGFAALSPYDFTLQTNDIVTPSNGEEFDFKGGQGIVWLSDMPLPNPFTKDVTKFYLTNANADEENAVTFKVLYDPTP